MTTPMPRIIFLLLPLFCLLARTPLAPAQEAAEDDGVRVAVLGYHVFAPQKESAMTIKTGKFRDQMTKLKQSEVPFITLDAFLNWRRGTGSLPPQSYLVTMDDGWESVYTEAFPILRDLKIPFVIYLYKNYVGKERGGRALSREAIREMLATGLCTIGSHSVSHPLPSVVRRQARGEKNAYLAYLRRELGESKAFLEKEFGVPVVTYAYPGGFHTPEMHTLADELGYEALFTVKPGKVRLDSDPHTLPRYIVLGNHDGAFDSSQIFRNAAQAALASADPEAAAPDLPFTVTPGANYLVPDRLPVISVDFSSTTVQDPGALAMFVGGFGKVPATWDGETKTLSWQTTRPLRQRAIRAKVDYSNALALKEPEPALTWTFLIDQAAAYNPQ